MINLDLDRGALRRHIKLVTAPLEESIQKARTIVHLQDLVAGGKKIWTKDVMPQLIAATHHTTSLTKRSNDLGDGFSSFDRWRKDNRSSERMFPAALIFLASAAKKKLQDFLSVQRGLDAAIEEHQKQMNYCNGEIERERNCGLLAKVLEPFQTIQLDEIEEIELDDEDTWQNDLRSELVEGDAPSENENGNLIDLEEEAEEEQTKTSNNGNVTDNENDNGNDNDTDTVNDGFNNGANEHVNDDAKDDDNNDDESSVQDDDKERQLEERQQLRQELRHELWQERIEEQQDHRRRELKYYGTRKSDFLHGYPVVLEASILLDALLVHYSRAGMVQEELRIAKQLNSNSIRLEMVCMFQANWRFKKWSRQVTADAKWLRETHQRAKLSEAKYYIRSANKKSSEQEKEDRAVFLRYDHASKKIQRLAKAYIIKKLEAKKARLKAILRQRQRAKEIGAAAAAEEALNLKCATCGRPKKNFDEIRACIKKHQDFARRKELDEAERTRKKAARKAAAKKLKKWHKRKDAIDRKEAKFINAAKLIREKRIRAEDRKKSFLKRKGYELPITPERATLYLIKRNEFPHTYYKGLPPRIELLNKTCTIIMGRSHKVSDVVLDASNMPGLISRAHVRIHIKKHFITGRLQIQVEDMESTNGTFLNGTEIFPLEASASDESEEEPASFFSSSSESDQDEQEEKEDEEEKVISSESESEEDVAMDPESHKAQIAEFQELLMRCNYISDMGINIVDGLAQTLQPELFMDGEYLIREGDEGDDMFVVVSGGISINKRTAAGENNELARLGRGAAVGELALQGNGYRSASVISVGGMFALRISKKSIQSVKIKEEQEIDIHEDIHVDIEQQIEQGIKEEIKEEIGREKEREKESTNAVQKKKQDAEQEYHTFKDDTQQLSEFGLNKKAAATGAAASRWRRRVTSLNADETNETEAKPHQESSRRSRRSQRLDSHPNNNSKHSTTGRASRASSTSQLDFGDQPKYKIRVLFRHGDVLTLGCDKNRPSSLSQIRYELEIRPDMEEAKRLTDVFKSQHRWNLSRTLPKESIRLCSIKSSIRKKLRRQWGSATTLGNTDSDNVEELYPMGSALWEMQQSSL